MTDSQDRIPATGFPPVDVMRIEITPEIQEKIDQAREVINKMKLAFERRVPEMDRFRLTQHYVRFRKRLTDRQILKMIIMAQVIPEPQIYYVPGGDGWKEVDSDQSQGPKPAEWKKDD